MAAQRSGPAYNRFKRAKRVKLSGSVPFKRLSLKILWWHPTQPTKAHMAFEHTYACVSTPVAV
jgi:hypothetical protein